MKVVGYARVSTDKQRDEATIETQIALIERKCDEEKYQLLHIYRDEGVSGDATPLHERPAGSRLMEEARKGAFDAVMVYHTDRIARNPYYSERVAHELYTELGIRILDVSNNTDLDTDTGRMMYTVTSAIGSIERSRFLKRSLDATLRHAENGVWLGGLAPYGYRVEGKKKDARLRLSTEKIQGLDISEVEVVQMMYQWAAHEKISCFKIADRLQAMGVPTSYSRDEREVLTNKRKQRTANLWRAGRVRNMLVETYYKGMHQWGKRQKKKRPHELSRAIIERPVPSIVDEQIWELAQQTLTNNRMISTRNSKRQYLLRGKMKCGLCNLTYSGSVSRGGKVENLPPNRKHPTYEIKGEYILKPYYCCSGKNNHRGLYGQQGQRCPSRMVSSQIVEETVWTDIEEFLRNPVEVLEEIQSKLTQSDGGMAQFKKDLVQFKRSLDGMESEKAKVIGLYRKGTIDEDTLSSQLSIVNKNKAELENQISQIESGLTKLDDQQRQCQTTQDLLLRLNNILDGEVTFEVKREIVEALVDWIRVDTNIDGNMKTATIKVFYRFEKPENNRPKLTLTETGEGVHAGTC